MRYETYTKWINFEYMGVPYIAECYLREWEDGEIDLIEINFVLDENDEGVWHANMYEIIEAEATGALV